MPYGQNTLSWAQSGEADLAGYLLSYGTISGLYTHTIDVGLTATPANPSYTVSSLQRYGTLFWTVQAYDNAVPPNMSLRSNEVSAAIGPKLHPRNWP